MFNHSLRQFALAVLVCVFFALEAKADDPPATEPTTPEAVARAVEAAVAARDAERLSALCDNAGFLEKVMADVKGTIGFRTGVRQSLSDTLSRIFLESTTRADSYTLLRMRTREDKPSALFRLIGNEGGVGYHELMFTTAPTGEILVGDVYLAAGGENFSSMLTRLIMVGGEQAKTEEGDAHLTAMKEMINAQREGRYEDALQRYNELPEAVQQIKTIQIIRLSSASNVSDAAMREAGEQFRAFFPNDPAADIMLLDYYFINREWPEAHNCIKRIREFAGEDAYLDYLQGSVYLGSEKPDEARKMFEQAVKREPTLPSPHWGLLELELTARNHAATLARMRELESIGIEFSVENMRAEESYAEFVASPEFRQWLDEQQPTNEEAKSDSA